MPFAVPVIFHTLYQPINRAWTVERFGCGCPPIRSPDTCRFNANDFNLILWCGIATLCGLSWWSLVRSEFTRRESTPYVLVQSVGLSVLLWLCMRSYAAEVWL